MSTSNSPPQHGHVHAASDFHSLTPIQRDGTVVIRKYVQERNFSARQDLARNSPEQPLRITATAMIWMHANGRHLGIIGRLHSLARHRNQLSLVSDSKKRSQFPRSQAKGTRLGKFSQFHHRR